MADQSAAEAREMVKALSELDPPTVHGENPAERGWYPEDFGHPDSTRR